MTSSTPDVPADTAHATPHVPFDHRHTQWVLLAVAAGSFTAFWWAARLLGLPTEPGFDGSLLRQPGGSAAVAIVVAAALIWVSAAAVTLVARRHWVYAGALAASAGLAAWSFRGGPIEPVLLSTNPSAPGTGVFIVLLAEVISLGLLVGSAWLLVLPRVAGEPGETLAKRLTPSAQIGKAVFCQAVLVAVAVSLLVPTAEKKQAVFGVLFACMIATGVAQHFFRDEAAARWYWAGPILVGAAGYLLNAFGVGAQSAVETGHLSGSFAALARPLPLDYAGAGVVGALLGYWVGSDHPVPHAEHAATVTPKSS